MPIHSSPSHRTPEKDGRPCRACNALAHRKLVARDINRRVSDDPFTYYACGRCGLVFLEPLPADLPRYYEESYHGIPDSLEALTRSAEAHERFKLDIVRSVKSSGRVLEIGPGSGGFALLASRAGFEVTVIDMSRAACEFISRTVGVEAIHARDEIAALAAVGPADVIALWQVLEHLPDPFRLLQLGARKLKPDGVLIVATPNPRAIQFRLLRECWVHLDAPRHVTLIPPRLLRDRAVAAGLEPVWTTMGDAGSRFWNIFGWQQSLRHRFKDRLSVRATDRLASHLSRLSTVENLLGIGAAYTAVFRAPPG